MARVLISNIGTGDREKGYRKAKYEYNNEIKETPFIAKALTEFLSVDKLFLVGTKKSVWDSVYEEFGGDEEKALEIWDEIKSDGISEENLRIVEKQIDSFLGNKGSKCFVINYGINEKELWDNFLIFLNILENLKEGDEVYLDITHSFRSLALMNFIMLEFGNTIKKKNIKVNGIFYGMLEYSWENKGITPIVDLKILFDLLEWIKAIDKFINYGNSEGFEELLDNQDEKNFFKNFSLALQIGNLAALRNNVKKSNKYLKYLQNSNSPIIKLLTPKIEEFITLLNKEKESDFQLAVAKWFYMHKNYALSYIALVESIVTKVCEIKGYDLRSENDRNRAKKEISQIDNTLYWEIYRPANEVRRDIAHQLGKRSQNVLTDVARLKTFLEKTEEIFKELK